MSPTPLMLLTMASLAANVVLLFNLAPSASPRPASEVGAASATRINSPEPKGPTPALVHWDQLPTEDLPALVAQLKSEGYPPALLRAIAGDRVQRMYEVRRAAIYAAAEPNRYWKAGPGVAVLGDARTRAALRELTREQSALLQDLLGPDSKTSNAGAVELQRRRYGSITADKLAQVELINADYGELSRQVRQEAGALLLPRDREALAFLETQQREDLLQVLTPEEYEDYLLRTSPTANSLRRELVGMQPNEQEFRTVFALQRAFDEAYGSTHRRNTPEWQAERRAAQQKLIADVKAALGPDRGAEYELSRDPSYVQAVTFTEAQKLPKAVALEILQVQKSSQQQANALRGNRALTPAQRDAELDAMLQEAESRLKATLGENAFEAYGSTARRWMAVTRAVTAAPDPPLTPVPGR